MKSSGPVFTKQNPFQPAPRVGKAHYHPSCKQSLSNDKKKTTLSPVRFNQRSGPQLHIQSPESKKQHFATDGQPVFTEIWPSTDCGSPPASSATSADMETPRLSARAGKSTVSSELGVQQDTVMAKYIERFRHGRPQSREERQQMSSATGEEQLPFWWMSPSSLPHSSTPTKITDIDVIEPLNDGAAMFSLAGQRQRDRSPSPCRGSLSILSDTYQAELDDTEILHLQEKASRLLLRGECTLGDDSIHVSSEGLGSSDFSSPVSVDETVRRPLITSLIKSTAQASSDSVQAVSSQKSSVTPPLVLPTRREEDILFQWRLRRKIEQARECLPQSLQHSSLHGPTFSWQAPSLSHPSASGQASKQHQQPPELSQKAEHPHIPAAQPETKEAHRSSPPASGPPSLPTCVASGSSVSQPKTFPHVPAHMHLLCDVLPCPIQSSHASTQQNFSQSEGEARTKVARKKTFTDKPIPEQIPSGAIEGERPSHDKISERNNKEKAQTRELEKNEKKEATSFRKQKKSTRYAADREHDDGSGSANRSSSHQRVPKKVMPQQSSSNRLGARGFSTESCTADHPPPPSPVHCALGQVVSEVLFPTLESSPARRTADSPGSPPLLTSSAPPQSSVLPGSAQNSMEVISQLLQEAEDSDEKEFEDDPLLQVLRKQRKWVKEQIREVDSMLNECLDEPLEH